jgi:hypothetical protein
MAHGVKDKSRVRLNQTLHGYSDGHRQLASSIALKPKDVKTMLVLSDISGPGARINEEGYLTGYPLPESGMYALARTWLAPEMSRPGCVWTHTLLIDYADLATFESYDSLLKLFRRPIDSRVSDYNEPITIPKNGFDKSFDIFALAWAQNVIGSLYGAPKSKVVALRSSEFNVDEVVLAIWLQQWPRLRRAFRFCTFASSDRSVDGNVFDLQVLPSNDRTVRARFSNSIDADNYLKSDVDWVDIAVNDLFGPDNLGLRTFLRFIGGDIATGRAAFRPLCEFSLLTERFNRQPEAIEKAVLLLETEFGSTQAKAARAYVAEAALSNIEIINDHSIDFIFSNLELIPEKISIEHYRKIGLVLWKRNRYQFFNLINGNGILSSIAETLLQTLPVLELIEVIKELPHLASLVIKFRKDVLAENEFWKIYSSLRHGFTLADVGNTLPEKILAAIISAQRIDLASEVINYFGSATTLEVLGQDSLLYDQTYFFLWVEFAAADCNAVSEYLLSETHKSKYMIYVISKYIYPDQIKSRAGTDPWVKSYQSAMGDISKDAEIYLNSFLLSRALGGSSSSSAELACISFMTVHSAAEVSRISVEAWGLLDSRLPSTYFWLDWDKCQRIRAGVVELFFERQLPPVAFAMLTTSQSVFRLLITQANRSGRGHDYLKQVCYSLQNNSDPRFYAQLDDLKKILKVR